MIPGLRLLRSYWWSVRRRATVVLQQTRAFPGEFHWLPKTTSSPSGLSLLPSRLALFDRGVGVGRW